MANPQEPTVSAATGKRARRRPSAPCLADKALGELGALGIVLARTIRAFPRLDFREVVRTTCAFGYDAISLTLVIGVFIGFVLVLFSNIVVVRFGMRSLFGWASGYAVLREVGPFVTALVMTGRIGGRNAAELGAMQTGGQMEGLKGVGVDPFAILVAPRVLASAMAMTALGVIASVVAILSSILFGILVAGIDSSTFMASFEAKVTPADVGAALVKLAVFGIIISLVSTQIGLKVSGGARDVGDAAAKAVVTSAAWVTVLDWAVTFATGLEIF